MFGNSIDYSEILSKGWETSQFIVMCSAQSDGMFSGIAKFGGVGLLNHSFAFSGQMNYQYRGFDKRCIISLSTLTINLIKDKGVVGAKRQRL